MRPRSQSFMTAYANTGLLVDAASNTVSLSTCSPVLALFTPKAGARTASRHARWRSSTVEGQRRSHWTGLAKRSSEQMAHSLDGIGARCRSVYPALSQTATADLAPGVHPPRSGKSNCMSGLRVVIADDERPARAFLSGILRGFEDVEIVGEAAGGAECIELIDQLAPDLVLLDLQMPEIDGL